MPGLGITQPAGSVRLTNVCVVKLKRGGVKLEVAAYSNSVHAWRAGLERNVDAVLQTRAVFSNAARGVLAPRRDLEAAFGPGVDADEAALLVLRDGDAPEGEVEREIRLSALFRAVAERVSESCVDAETRRPVSAALIERALRAAGYSLAPSRGAKEQAPRAIAALAARPDLLPPLERARMRLRVTVPINAAPAMRDFLHSAGAESEAAPAGGATATWTASGDGLVALTVIIEPGAYRSLEERVAGDAAAGGAVQVLALASAAAEAAAGSGVALSGRRVHAACAGAAGVCAADTDGAHARGRGGANAAADALAELSLRSPSVASVADVPVLAAVEADEARARADASARGTGMSVVRATQPGARLSCATCCGAHFADAAVHRTHHRSDWHRYNLKAKVRGLAQVTEHAFDGLTAAERAAILDALE